MLGVAVIGAVAVALLPWLGVFLTDGQYPVPAAAVLAWVAYAVAAAALLPYGRLALVHGGQRRVLALRAWELASVVAVVFLLLAVDGSEAWTPLALAVGPAVAAVAVRQSVLMPLVRRENSARPLEPAGA
jgi:hypothetical protein